MFNNVSFLKNNLRILCSNSSNLNQHYNTGHSASKNPNTKPRKKLFNQLFIMQQHKMSIRYRLRGTIGSVWNTVYSFYDRFNESQYENTVCAIICAFESCQSLRMYQNIGHSLLFCNYNIIHVLFWHKILLKKYHGFLEYSIIDKIW
jgi:hypothetical protein